MVVVAAVDIIVAIAVAIVVVAARGREWGRVALATPLLWSWRLK